jgi:anti-sigma B factor antagonist
MTNDANAAGPAQHRPPASGAPASSAPASGAPASGAPASSAPASGAPVSSVPASRSQARFEFVPAGEHEPATVRAAGDIDLTNVGPFQAALDQAGAASGAVTADLTAVTYCDSAAIRALFIAARQARLTIRVAAAGPINEILLKVSGLDQIATVVTLH